MDTRKSLRRLSFASLAALAAACVIGGAQAQTPDVQQLHRVTVKYGDLNLTTESGARTLYQRIRGAARFVCGEEGRSLDEQRQWDGCYHSTVDDAVTAVHSPLLTSIYNTDNPRPQATAMLTY